MHWDIWRKDYSDPREQQVKKVCGGSMTGTLQEQRDQCDQREINSEDWVEERGGRRQGCFVPAGMGEEGDAS